MLYAKNRTFNQNTTEKCVSSILKECLHSKTEQSLSNSVLGLIVSKDAKIHAIGEGLAEATGKEPKHTIKQTDRMLSNNNIQVEKISGNLLKFLIGQRKEIYVILDWTEFDNDKHSTLVLSFATKHGRATPFLWKTIDKNDLKGKRNSYEDQLLTEFHDILPDGIKVTLLADRGFSSCALLEKIENHFHWDYVIRIRRNIVVDLYGEKVYSGNLVEKGQSRLLKNVKITLNGYVVKTLAVEWDEDMKEPWCLVSTKPTHRTKKIVRYYAKRWSTEPTFRDVKDPKFGFGMKATHISCVNRRDRLWLVIALAIIILTILGAASEILGYDKHLKANTVKRRTHSLFKQGLKLWRLTTNMPLKKAQLLFETFEELLYKAIPSATQPFDFI